jgi:hypothetical protein
VIVVTSLGTVLDDKAGTEKPAQGIRVMPAEGRFERQTPSDAGAAAPARIPMPVGARLAIPAEWPRTSRASVRRHQLLRWLATCVTIVAAAVAILVAAVAAVMLGIS